MGQVHETAWGAVELGDVPPTERVRRFDAESAAKIKPGTVLYYDRPIKSVYQIGTVQSRFIVQRVVFELPSITLEGRLEIGDVFHGFTLSIDEVYEKLS